MYLYEDILKIFFSKHVVYSVPQLVFLQGEQNAIFEPLWLSQKFNTRFLS